MKPQVAQHDQGREEIYALRRVLVRQLQRTTSRTTRSERYATHHRFVAEWEVARDRGSWDSLLAVLRGSAVAAEPGLLTRLAAASRWALAREGAPALDWGALHVRSVHERTEDSPEPLSQAV